MKTTFNQKHLFKTQLNGGFNLKKNKAFFNHDGLTLLEVLAVLVITIIVAAILFSIIISGHEQYKNQSQKNLELTDASYHLKVFTKDIRKSRNVSWENSTLTLDGVPYSYSNNSIKKNGTIFIDNVIMEVETITNSKNVTKIEIEVNGVSTTIVVRSGISIDET